MHFALAAWFSLTTPPWESYDEVGHYGYARYIAVNRALPPPGLTLSIYNETHQPPLYYVLIAPAIALVDTSDDVQPKFTPLGLTFSQRPPAVRLAASGTAWVAPDPALSAFPYHGTILALHLGRLVSALFSSLAVLLTYLTVRTLLPGRGGVALLAAALHALWPQYVFLSGAISNDVGIAVAGSFVLWAAARLLKRRRPGDYVVLAVALAGATLMKDSAVSLLLFGALAAGLALWKGRAAGWRKQAAYATTFAAVAATLTLAGSAWSGGRSLRQFSSAGGYVSESVYAALPAAQPATQPATPPGGDAVRPAGVEQGAGLWERIPTLIWYFDTLKGETFDTLFAAYSHGSLRLPAIWYLLARLSLLALVPGWVLCARRPGDRRALLLMLLCFACVALAPVARAYYAQNLSLMYGRFFTPGLGALVIAVAVGLSALPAAVRRLGGTYVLGVVALAACLSPYAVIMPAFRTPALLDPVARPPDMQVAQPIIYGNSIELLGYSQTKVPRGQGAMDITLYWRALQPMTRDYVLRLEPFSLDGQSFLERFDVFPGRNVFPTSYWEPGDTFADTYSLPASPYAPRPTLATVLVNWLDMDTGQTLTPACPGDRGCVPKVGALPVALDAGEASRWAGKAPLYHLGESIDLLAYQVSPTVRAGRAVSVSLVWRAAAGGLPDVTTFVHIAPADGAAAAQAAQQDQPPRNGLYPSSVWQAGEVVPDEITIPSARDLPPGRYWVTVGMYDSQTRERLTATDAAGRAQRDNLIRLAELQVR